MVNNKFNKLIIKIVEKIFEIIYSIVVCFILFMLEVIINKTMITI